MKPWFNFINKVDGQRAEIRIYGAIVDTKWNETDPDVTPQDFAAELEKFKDYKELDIFINSPGGNVFAGLAIYHMLKRHPANKTVYNDGMIASIASVIAMAGSKIVMPPTSMMLIHKALVIGIGNAEDFLSLAAELDKVDGVIAEAYAGRMKKPIAEIKEIMAKDAFMSAKEAKELGLADDIGEERDMQASIEGENLIINGVNIDVSRFKNFPKDKFQAVKTPQDVKEVVAQETTPAPVPVPEPVVAPDFSIYEAQIVINNNTL